MQLLTSRYIRRPSTLVKLYFGGQKSIRCCIDPVAIVTGVCSMTLVSWTPQLYFHTVVCYCGLSLWSKCNVHYLRSMVYSVTPVVYSKCLHPWSISQKLQLHKYSWMPKEGQQNWFATQVEESVMPPQMPRPKPGYWLPVGKSQELGFMCYQ